MRLTVGPLPPAVYWRRRAMVLGVILLFVLVIVYSCAGSGKSPASGSGTSTGATPTPKTSILTPTTGSPSAEPSTSPSEVPTGTSTSQPTAPSGNECTDEEISVVPVPSQTSVQRGVTIEIRLKIKNISNRKCDRDVGAGAQEIYITLGAQPIWSSDACSDDRSSNVVSLTVEHEYRVAWNGKASTRCDNGVASGELPEAGEYQVFARLGTKHSEPVKLVITG